MTVQEILKITKGKLICGKGKSDINLASISSDSRKIKKGEFFLPLKGNNFNGEDFIADAFKRGAIGAFTTNSQLTTHPGLSSATAGTGNSKLIIIRVKDTTIALQRIAHCHRKKFSIPVIGVTGSNGKTTVKEMIAKVLSYKFNVLKNEGTKNNHIGLPQTLLKLNKEHAICVLEMGTNHKDEIRLLSGIARPDVAVITNVGHSHLEFLKNLKGVFKAKIEIFDFLNKDGIAIINGDDENLSALKNMPFRIMRFGFNDKNDFRASRLFLEGHSIKFLLNDRSPFTLNLLGTHNAYNALAAIAVAYNFGLSYEATKKALSEFAPANMRLNEKNIDGILVINDAYNSNPLSMRCALEAMKTYPAKARWVVSSDMLELGRREEDFHAMIGETIAKSNFDGLVTFGVLSRLTSSRAIECGMKKDRVWHCSSRQEVADILRKMARRGDAVLIKGSRAMKMEEVVEKLEGVVSRV